MDKKIEGFENYTVNEFGIVKNIKTGRILKAYSHAKGYLSIELRGIENKQFLIHRLVAKEFLENYDDKLTIDHIDGNKKNNHISNLECVTIKENVNRFLKKNKVKRISKKRIIDIYKSKEWINIQDFFEELIR